MKIIIIAAGYGSRLGEHTKELPKALLDINGKSILERQYELLKIHNQKKIIVITGPYKTKFKNKKFQYVDDYLFKEHEQLGSLMAARSHFDEELLVIFSDVLFDNKILSKILNTKCNIGIVVDLDWQKRYDKRTEHPISQADLVLVTNNKITRIQKNLKINMNSNLGEFIGIMKLSKKGAKIFLEHFQHLEKNHRRSFQNAESLQKAYLTDMIQDLIDEGMEITPIFIEGDWCEIDTPQDLVHAKEMFR